MQTYGSVVAMEFRTRPSVSFQHIVEEFDNAFQMVDARSRSLSWDCDDVAIIDRDDLRVALGWLPATDTDPRWHLIIAVGIPPMVEAEELDTGSIRYLASAIAERTQDYLPFSAVMHGEATQPIGADLMDLIFELVRHDASDIRKDAEVQEDDTQGEVCPDEAAEAGVTPLQEGTGTPKLTATDIFSHVQESLGVHLTDAPASSEPRRLSIHGIALGLCVLAPPVGAGMLTYTLLRDMISDDDPSVAKNAKTASKADAAKAAQA